MTEAYRTSIETKEKEIGVARTIIESFGEVYRTSAHSGTSDVAVEAVRQIQRVLFKERLLQKALVDLERTLSEAADQRGFDTIGERATSAAIALAEVLDAEIENLYQMREGVEALLRLR